MTTRVNKLRRQGMRWTVFSTVLLIALVLAGGSFLAVLLHLQRLGMLSDFATLIEAFFVAKDIDIALVIFWLLVIPVLLAVILVVNLVRKRKFSYYRRTWEETAKSAMDEERRAYREEWEKQNQAKRFSVLNEIKPEAGEEEESGVHSLKELCTGFRLFAANKLHLYYTEVQIREFVASLAVSHILILQGMSGTGKTSLTYAFGEYVKNPSVIVPVQPMWKERSDLLGYYNEFTKKYNETELLRKMYEANGNDRIYITVLDEMNIARVEYYFAEFLSLLEIPNPELRYLEVVSDVWKDDPPGLKDGRIKLPENMWFVGTVNNDDSTFAISDKVYDRAMIIDLETRTAPFGDGSDVPPAPVSFREFTGLAANAQRGYEITKRNERRLKELDEFLIKKFQITFGNRIMRQIRSYISIYVSCGGEELDALDDILSKKVLRKLVYKDLAVYRKELKEAVKFLETLFGTGAMPKCREALTHMARA